MCDKFVEKPPSLKSLSPKIPNPAPSPPPPPPPPLQINANNRNTFKNKYKEIIQSFGKRIYPISMGAHLA